MLAFVINRISCILVRMNQRTIFHIDMDAFFASIEILKQPSLKGKAVIVGGRPDRRGVVSTCSYEARKFGVHSAMPLSHAKKLCPHAIFLEGHYSLYREYSEKIMAIFKSLTHRVEIVSIDEAYLDVTDIVEKYAGARALGEVLKQAVFQNTHLTSSIGIAANKLVAKIASGMNKPNGFCEVLPGEEPQFLAPLRIQSIPGIGEKTQEILNNDGIKLISDLQALGLDTLMARYGGRGYQYFQAALGRDNRPVEWQDLPPKSIGAETTFETDQIDKIILINALKELTEKACRQLIKNKMRTRSISIKLRDSFFKTFTRTHPLFSDTNDSLTIQEAVIALFETVDLENAPLRLIGVSLKKLSNSYWQPTLF